MWVNKSVSAGFAVCSRGIAFLQASLGCKSGSFFFLSFFFMLVHQTSVHSDSGAGALSGGPGCRGATVRESVRVLIMGNIACVCAVCSSMGREATGERCPLE